MRRLGDDLGVDLFKEIGLTRSELFKMVKNALWSHKQALKNELSLKSTSDEETAIVNSLVDELTKEFKIPD
jgi:hypothetical protein